MQSGAIHTYYSRTRSLDPQSVQGGPWMAHGPTPLTLVPGLLLSPRDPSLESERAQPLRHTAG